jgi:hypothetical protein
MIALSNEEWAILLFLVVLFLGILYARSNRKKKSRRLRSKIARDVYNTAMEAQVIAIEGVKKSGSTQMGASIHHRSTPMDLQDPSRLYVRSTLLELRNQESNNAHRDYLLENEYLNIDEPSRAY